MMNMSYCRFENTLKALNECASVQPYMEGEEELSKSEQQAWKEMQEVMANMLEEAGYTVYPPGEEP